MADDQTGAEETASREATNWLILLQDDPDNPDLRERFTTWLDASPRHARAWHATGEIDFLIRSTEPTHQDQWRHAMAHADQSRPTPTVIRPRRSQTRGRRGWIPLAGLALAACLLLAIFPTISMELQSDYTTGTAEMRTITLQDGSTVTLAPETALSIDFASEERQVSLLSGSAFFSVESHPDRPFRVLSGNLVTTVTGTEFAVRLGDREKTVAVSEGSVQIDYRSSTLSVSETLIAGQSASINRSGTIAQHSIAPSNVAAWRENRLIVQDEPMGAVIDLLRGYHHGTIILAGPDLADLPITGYYSLTDPESAIRAVAQAHSLTVRRITPWILILSES